MAYERLHWVESETPLSADNMNNIEDGIEELQSQKVDKVSGKALSDQNYTSDEKTKLAGIESGAEVNVQSDWDQSDSSADDYIKNKPGNASTSTAGLMSAADKTKLDGLVARMSSITIGSVITVPRTVSSAGKTATFNYTFPSDGYFEIYNNGSGSLPVMGWDLVIGNMPIDITFKYNYTKTVNSAGSAATFETGTGHGRQVYFVREGMILSGGFVIGPPLLAESIVTKFYPISY